MIFKGSFPTLPVALLAGALVFLARSCAADTPAVRSVDVYPRGARFVFELAPTENSFQFELPGAFDAKSVRLLNLTGVSDLQVVEQGRKGWIPPSLAPLKERTDAQAKAISLMKAKAASLEQTRAMLNVSTAQIKGTEGRDLIRYMEDAQTLRLKVENELADLTETLRLETEELERLEAELESRSPRRSDQIVQVSGRANTREPLLFEARTDAARWGLRYVMDLNSATGAIDVHMFASAAQGTGLDYSGDLTFHSRQPEDSVSPPVLNPLRVALRPKHPIPVREMPALGYGISAPAPMAVASHKEMLDGASNTMDDQGDEAVEFGAGLPVIESTLSNVTVRGRGTLEGDGSPSDVALGALSLESTPTLVLIPEQRSKGWIVASMDAISTPLMPGRAELRVDGRPSGYTDVPEYGLGQTRLPFGSASRLSAKKTPLVESTGSSWLGGSGVFKSGYTLEVASGMDSEREVTVRDRLPIPVDEKIKLEVLKIDPEPTERDAENRLSWKLSVKPGETRKIVVEYTLSYPSGETLEYR